MADDPVLAWNLREIQANELVRAFKSELVSIAAADGANNATISTRMNWIHEELRRYQGQFGSSVEFIAWASATLAVAQAKWQRDFFYYFSTLPRKASKPSDITLPEIYVPPRDSPEHEPTDLSISVSNLAAAVDHATDDHLPFLRLLALRVIGGWSLAEIARRDAVSLEHLAETWSEARKWIQARQNQNIARVQTFDLIDLKVIETLLRDRKLASSINWRSFEKILAALLDRLGYEIELQQGTKDGGVDILAIKRESPFGPHRYLLQAKRWQNKVGVEAVRELLFLKQHLGATKACLATTSTFTSGAWQLGYEYRWQLELRDFERLQEWLDLVLSVRAT